MKNQSCELNFRRVWYAMKTRCENIKSEKYPIYGGRGVKVLWKSYADFRLDMYRSYIAHRKTHGRDTTINRIDNSRHYSKENCEWTTQKIQQRNRRDNRLVTYHGKTLCLAEWADILGIKVQTLWARLRIYNWPVERALTTPVN